MTTGLLVSQEISDFATDKFFRSSLKQLSEIIIREDNVGLEDLRILSLISRSAKGQSLFVYGHNLVPLIKAGLSAAKTASFNLEEDFI
jgi:hypothetical protein